MENDILVNAMANLDEELTLKIVREKIAAGETAFSVVKECRKGIEVVGKKYGKGEYYLSDLVMSEAIFKDVMELIEPHFPKDIINNDNEGTKIVIGTIEGDIHDLGKNIVVYLLKSAGYKVYDLGVDVKPEQFIQAIKETGAPVLGVSVLLTFCIGNVKRLVDMLKEVGLKDKVSVVIGGYPVNSQIKEYTGVDYYANDAMKALELFNRLFQ